MSRVAWSKYNFKWCRCNEESVWTWKGNISLKRVLLLSMCVLVLSGFVGCREKRSVSIENEVFEEKIDNGTESKSLAGELVKIKITEKSAMDGEKEYMKLYLNDTEIPVIWEDNQTVQELMKEASKQDVVVQMAMYSDNEQVGSLKKSYTTTDEQMTTHNGDIVLYSGDKIVVFYGSNSWAYTRLGKMNIPEGDVTKLLSNGDVTLKMTILK